MPLPYGPRLTRLLRPLQRGFLFVNRWLMAPALKAGLGRLIGNPLTSHQMLLRTRGRKTGLPREAPLGYVILDGAVYCVAGYGETTAWYRNLLAEPAVELILPSRRLRGRADPVADPAEWTRAYRALIASFGLIGRAIVGDIGELDDETLLARHRALPVVRITPTDAGGPLTPGRWDPGGNGWLVANGAVLLAAAGLARLLRRGPTRSRGGRARAAREPAPGRAKP